MADFDQDPVRGVHKLQPQSWSPACSFQHVFSYAICSASCARRSLFADCPQVLLACRAELLHIAGSASWVGYVSSTGVYGDHQGQWVDERWPCSTLRLLFTLL